MPAKYLIIARELEQTLRRSAHTGQRLPTEAALCAEFGCSRQTVRSALAVLEEKGLIVRRQGSGSFPAQSAPMGNRQIAVLLADKDEYTSPALLRDIRKAAGDSGCTVTCLETHGSWEREWEHLTRLLSQPPAGILLEPICDGLGCFCEDLLRRFAELGVPVIAIGGSYPGIPSVRFDDATGAGMLMAHLAQAHRNIAGILRSDESSGISRFRGCRAAAGDIGLNLRQENVLWYSAEERLRLLDGDDSLLHRFLDGYLGNCSAVVCQNDEIAYRLLRFLRRVQQEIAIVSFDNSYLALSRDASLTSLGPDSASPGTEAVRLLLQRMEGREAESIILPWHLYVRKSG